MVGLDREMRMSDGVGAYGLCEEEVVIFRLNSQVFEYRIRPETFHVILNGLLAIVPDIHHSKIPVAYPVFYLAMPYRIMKTIACFS
jgi:hypothetical protein